MKCKFQNVLRENPEGRLKGNFGESVYPASVSRIRNRVYIKAFYKDKELLKIF